MKRKTFLTIITVILLSIACLLLIRTRYQSEEPQQHRQMTEQIVAYRDDNRVEYYYDNSNGHEPVEVRIEIIIDGFYQVAKAVVQPGESGTVMQTRNGEPYSYFRAGIYKGRLLVFDLATGKLMERVKDLEFRIYNSVSDPYDALAPREAAEKTIHLDPEEYRPEKYLMRADVKLEELNVGLSGLFSEWRALDSYIYVAVDGEDILIAKQENIPPRSIWFDLDLEGGACDLLENGKTYSVHVESFYSDTGEWYDSIAGTVEVYQSA